MPRWILPFGLATLFATAVLWWDHADSAASRPTLPAEAARSVEPVQPLPRSVELDSAKVALGARLFRDPSLSRDGTIACASCHTPEFGGADGRARSVGIGGAIGEINAPSIFNSGLSFRLFWDGRAQSLEEQIDGPLTSPVEMGASWDHALSKIAADPSDRRAFGEVYGDAVTERAVRDAIATFERSLITPDSRFDQYLRGDRAALSDAEQRGYELFKHYGCIGCHQGMLLGGNMFQRLGIVRDYFAERGGIERADLGRYNVTGDEADRHVFKVPSLRNVALTAPYFHDGSAATLPDAIRAMARYQLGRDVPDADVGLIASFLDTLTGDLRGSL